MTRLTSDRGLHVNEERQTRRQLVEAFIPHSPHAASLGISIESLLRAEARVLRRGRRLSNVEVRATDPDGRLVAHGIATYKLG